MSTALSPGDRGLLDAVMEAFTAFLDGDAPTVARIRGHGGSFRIRDGAWYFTLVDLHEFLGRRHAGVAQLPYERFRSCLYRLPVNRLLGERGASVIVGRGTGRVDDTVYVLAPSVVEADAFQRAADESNSDAVAAGPDGK